MLVLDEEDDDLEDGDFHHVESDSDDSVEIDRPVASSIAKVAAKLERFGLPGWVVRWRCVGARAARDGLTQ